MWWICRGGSRAGRLTAGVCVCRMRLLWCAREGWCWRHFYRVSIRGGSCGPRHAPPIPITYSYLSQNIRASFILDHTPIIREASLKNAFPELTLKPIIFRDHLAIRKRHVSIQAPPRLVLALSKVRHVLLAIDAKSTLYDIIVLFLAALPRSILFILLNLRQLLRCREVATVNDVGL